MPFRHAARACNIESAFRRWNSDTGLSFPMVASLACLQFPNYTITKLLNPLMNAVLIVDKPPGLTSHDVVNRVRRILAQRSVGHLGTLDPMATGVLPLVAGSFTRLAQFYTSAEKTYEGTIRFGFATDTYDAEGEPLGVPQPVILKAAEIEVLALDFRGVIEQMPPPFSAKKIHGIPAYKLARKHKDVTLSPVKVEIKEFAILGVDADRARFRARVASGTYMRSVAHDMGQRLGCGAHLESLRRTAVAEFTAEDAHTLEEFAAAAGKNSPILTGHDAPSREAAEQSQSHPRPPDRVQNCHSEPARSGGEEPALPNGSAAASEGPSVSTPANMGDLAGPGATGDNSPAFQRRVSVRIIEPRPGGTAETLDDLFVHPRRLLPHLPCVTADEASAARIRSGRTVNLPELSRARQVKVFYGQRELIAIATRVAGTLFHPGIVFCGADTPVRQDSNSAIERR